MAKSVKAKSGAAAPSVSDIKPEVVVISPPNFKKAAIRLRGTSPYVGHRFSEKSLRIMEDRQRAGEQGKKDKKREARDFEADYLAAIHVSREGWYGIPAPCFRNAAISACRVAGFAMTRAKLSLFVIADGYDHLDGSPLVRIYGECRPTPPMSVRNESGVADLRVRPVWEEWYVDLTLRWDGDQFSFADVFNLLNRAGNQVGIGEGRPDSPHSNGLGWGTFEVDTQQLVAA